MMRQVTHSFWREAYLQLCREVDQVLGKALGYPYYSADQKNFPGTTEADGVCTGEHVPESILNEAAKKITEKSLTFKEFENTPCTAELEVKLERLATYFERRARENAKRAEKLEGKLTTFTDLIEVVKSERGAYYFSGKEDSYKNAARKLRELLAPPVPEVNTWTWKYWKEPEPELWIIELDLGLQKGWVRARNSGVKGEFSSVAEANAAIKSNGLPASWYRVVRK